MVHERKKEGGQPGASSPSDLNSPFERGGLDRLVLLWSARVSGESELVPHIPLAVLTSEAVGLAELIEFHEEPRESGGVLLPGLRALRNRAALGPAAGQELRELSVAIGALHGRSKALRGRNPNELLVQAHAMLSEFRSVLGYLLENGKHALGEKQLTALRREFGRTRAGHSIACALEGYAALAYEYERDLEELAGFDTSLVDDALRLAQALRQRSAEQKSGRTGTERRELLSLRNRLVHLLTRRMLAIRRTFRFVFRAHPAIARKAGSAYVREGRRSRAT